MPSNSTAFSASGGTLTTSVVGNLQLNTHTFNLSGSFVISSATAGDSIDYIVVGGGGGGTYNNYVGSGGGGAEVKYGNSEATITTYTVTIGSGGAAKIGSYGGGANGGISSLVGGTINFSSSGGPGSGMNGNPDATGTYTYGTGSSYSGAGAGGAGQAGQGSNGGAGKLITTGVFSTNNTYYGGGGAGGLAASSGLSMLYGGAGGGANTTLSGGQPATPNSGGGGAGGSATQGTPASNGADGVIIVAYYVIPPDGLYASANLVYSGENITFSLLSANTGNIPYTITGVTSEIINNTPLTGNFDISSNSGQLTIPIASLLTSGYTLSLSADGYTVDVDILPLTSINTSIIGIGYPSSESAFSLQIAGQMNIYNSVVTTDATVTTQVLLPKLADMQSNVSLPYTTMTNKIAGPIEAGVIKVFGDNPNREYWM